MNATVIADIVLEIEERVKKCVVRMNKAKARKDTESAREEKAVAADLKDLRAWIVNKYLTH
jgi:hypothetical protein